MVGCNTQLPLIKDTATVVGINIKQGYVTLFWGCDNPPYKLQPCFSYSEHPIYLFDNPQINDEYKLIKIK